MGCDIHGTIEKYHNGEWVMIEHLSYYTPATERNYARFGWLANVRSTSKAHPEPKGIPDDVSLGTQYHLDKWDNDGHSHSWHGLATTAEIFAKTQDINGDPQGPTKVDLHRVIEDAFDLYTYSPDGKQIDLLRLEAEYRFVFWFDN